MIVQQPMSYSLQHTNLFVTAVHFAVDPDPTNQHTWHMAVRLSFWILSIPRVGLERARLGVVRLPEKYSQLGNIFTNLYTAGTGTAPFQENRAGMPDDDASLFVRRRALCLVRCQTKNGTERNAASDSYHCHLPRPSSPTTHTPSRGW